MTHKSMGQTTPSARSELASLMTGPSLVVLMVSITLALWGVFDGMTDA